MGFVATMTFGVASTVWLGLDDSPSRATAARAESSARSRPVGAEGVQTTSNGQASFESLMKEGSELAEQGHFEESLARLVGSYEAMPSDLQVDELGRFTVELAMESFRRTEANRADVEAALRLLDRYFEVLSSARANDEPTVLAGFEEGRLVELRVELRRRLDTWSESLPPDPAVAAPVTIEPSSPAPEEIADRAGPTPKRRPPPGVGLLASGSVLLAGSVPLLVQGFRFPALVDAESDASRAALDQQIAQDPTLTIDEDAWEEHERQQRRIGYVYIGAGVTVLAVSVALLTWGGIRASQHKHASAESPRTRRVAFDVTPTGDVVIHF